MQKRAASAAIVDYVRYVAPQVLIWSVYPNGGLRSKSEAARLKWTGVLAGVFDLTLAICPKGRCSSSAGRPRRPSGQGFQSIVGTYRPQAYGVLGHVCAVVRDIDDARRELAELGIKTREAFA